VWQRPNHVLSRLRSRAEVIVVEEELVGDADVTHVLDRGGLIVVTPQRRRPHPGVDGRTVDEVRRLVRGRPALLWLYSPLMIDLASAVPTARLVYDKMDELASFKGADPALVECEDRLCARADFVFAGGRTLWDSVKDRVRAGEAVPSGVDVAHYAAFDGQSGLSELGDCPVFGYIGVLDERLDLQLIAAIARARFDATFVLVGPVAKIDPASLPRAANIRYYDKRPYADLPAIVARFDVAIMPFARNEATRSISPTKTLEYLAARRPVVSTAIADVVADFGDVVYVAHDASGFVAALAIAQQGDAERRELGFKRATAMTWDSIVDRMVAALERAGVIASRR